MNILFSLNLPRDEASVPVVRHVCRDALAVLGVDEVCVSEIELAVAEACTNVLKHVEGTEDQYEVKVEVSEQQCQISVLDTGGGFDHSAHGGQAPSTAESGRGIAIMQALVDDVRFVSEPESGTVVHLVKHLALAEDSVLKRLAAPTA